MGAPFSLKLSTLGAALVLAGCSLAPTYEQPEAPIPGKYPQVGASETELAQADSEFNELGWDQFFNDPQLKELIDVALENNRDVRIALDRVLEAQAQFGIARSDQFPAFGIGGSGEVTRMPSEMRIAGPESPAISRTFQAGVGMTAFELDFFGRLKNLSESAFQQFLATAESQRTVQINVIAAVAESYLRWRAAQTMLQLTEQTEKSRRETLNLVTHLYEVGTASALDLEQARLQLDTVRADLKEMQRQLSLAKNALELVLGTSMPDDLPESIEFSQDQIISSIPVGLPSSLLVRRPDIRAAEHQLKAAYANVGAARAAFFPQISLTGLFGLASPSFSRLFRSGNDFWQYSPQITMPLFSGGVEGAYDLAKARQNIAVSEYEKTIQTAFKEVADALAGEATYQEQLDAMRAMERSAAESLRLANLRYETGIDSFLQVQTAEVNLYGTQLQFVQIGLESLLNRLNLYKALGGGWNFDQDTLEALEVQHRESQDAQPSQI
ncbi:MAG TPA: efflux transporter outer membrane subunit [Paenalcaligenes sp.]|nr:efflux transporter outer membrane subunit [Paenalcaligenes sp.]